MSRLTHSCMVICEMHILYCEWLTSCRDRWYTICTWLRMKYKSCSYKHNFKNFPWTKRNWKRPRVTRVEPTNTKLYMIFINPQSNLYHGCGRSIKKWKLYAPLKYWNGDWPLATQPTTRWSSSGMQVSTWKRYLFTKRRGKNTKVSPLL